MKVQVYSLLFILVLFSPIANAQQKKFYADFFVEQNIMLGDWFNEKNYDELTENLNSTDVGARLNMRLYNQLGIWVSLNFTFRNERKTIPDNVNLFSQINLESYYMDSYFRSPNRNFFEDMEGKFAFGFLYRHQTKKWGFTPYFGLGLHSIVNNYRVSYSLKEIGANTAYSVDYKWGFNDDIYGEDYQWIPYLTLQFKADYKLSDRLRIFGGISFNQYIQRMKMQGRLRDYYDNDILVDSFKIRGRLVNTLGVSAGISF